MIPWIFALTLLVSVSATATAQTPVRIEGARCVRTCGGLIRHSDVIAMRPEPKAETYKKYRVDVVAWGAGVGFDEKSMARQRRYLKASRAAGLRLYAVDCVAVAEGTQCVITNGDPHSPRMAQLSQLRSEYDDVNACFEKVGIDPTQGAVLDVHGKWIRVPWGGDRRNLPMASIFWPAARQWYLRKMERIAALGGTALHIDEPALSACGLIAPSPGDFSDYAMSAFREWLHRRPADVWRKAGIESLDGFNYRGFVLARGADPRSAPLWREFVRFQLFSVTDFLREMRDHVRAKTGRPIPLSMNAHPATWYKLPLLSVQDLMTTEVGHEAKRLRMPLTPLLLYKFGDAIGQPVATTAHGGEWHKMCVDPHPVLVCSWLAMGYALGHHLMMPVKAWMTPRVNGTDAYRPKTDHYACVAQFVKQVAHLLDGHEAMSCMGVALSCDAIERDIATLKILLVRLANMNVPFHLAVEGNDLFERQIGAQDLDGCSAVLVASPNLMPDDARKRIRELAGKRPVVEYSSGSLPASLPRPIRVEGADRVWVLPRAVPGDEATPVAIHLLNRDYDPAKRQMRAKRSFTVELDARLFRDRSFNRAVLHQPILLPTLPSEGPFDDVVAVKLSQDSRKITLTVPGLDVWGIVELD